MKKINLAVNLAGVTLKNPVVTASGTFNPQAHSQFYDLSLLGGVTLKGVADVPWPGNPTPRIAETYGGMLNSVGLQNPGIDALKAQDLPFMRQFDTRVIVNTAGHSVEEYCRVSEALQDAEGVDLVELNISCPNVKVLAQKMGGFSGPAVKPVAVRMVYQVHKAVQIPILGMGGIMTGEDAVEFIMAGATAVATGTANLVDPKAPIRIIEEMRSVMEKMGVDDINSLRGIIE